MGPAGLVERKWIHEEPQSVVDDPANDLIDVVMGDPTHLEAVLLTPHHVLEEVTHRLPPLNVTRQAAARVIESLLRGEISSRQAQRWASFVRRGYASQSSTTPITPIDIAFEPACEDAIAEAVSRLDELGDAVDGILTREDLESVSSLLRSPS
jgi:hypothetical protein